MFIMIILDLWDFLKINNTFPYIVSLFMKSVHCVTEGLGRIVAIHIIGSIPYIMEVPKISL